MLTRLVVHGHRLHSLASTLDALLFQHLRLHLSSLLLDLISLFDNEIAAADILIRNAKRDDGVEFLTVILLVEVHAVGQHLFNVTNLDRHVGSEHRAVNIDATWVVIIEAPDPKVALVEGKVTTSLEVK